MSAARMVKLVNTVDLKSAARKGFPVQVRVRAPSFINLSKSDLLGIWLRFSVIASAMTCYFPV
jgi:hypothetical protein